MSQRITALGKKKVTPDEIKKCYHIKDYIDLTEQIKVLTSIGEISPVKNAGKNGKNPALYNLYWVKQAEKDNNAYIEEINFSLHPLLQPSYYLKHLDTYEKDRENVLRLSNYLKTNQEFLNTPISLNERSFQIWSREKYLQKEGGIQLLKNLNLSVSFLNIYETTEPIAYYSHSKAIPQNIIILENKDTYYSMRKHLISGTNQTLGITTGSLIYGAGKGIIKAFRDFQISSEPYMLHKTNQILYFGDLDYEGIMIYESFYKQFHEQYQINVLAKGYETMIRKSEGVPLPLTKDGQNRNVGEIFFPLFSTKMQKRMNFILNSNLYIPQEILNESDF